MMPLNQILNFPKEHKWRNVDTGTFFLKKVGAMCADALPALFSGLGFCKATETTFKFQKLSTEEAAATTDPLTKMQGNSKALSYAVKVFSDKQLQLKNPAAYSAAKAQEEAKIKQEQAQADKPTPLAQDQQENSTQDGDQKPSEEKKEEIQE